MALSWLCLSQRKRTDGRAHVKRGWRLRRGDGCDLRGALLVRLVADVSVSRIELSDVPDRLAFNNILLGAAKAAKGNWTGYLLVLSRISLSGCWIGSGRRLRESNPPSSTPLIVVVLGHMATEAELVRPPKLDVLETCRLWGTYDVIIRSARPPPHRAGPGNRMGSSRQCQRSERDACEKASDWHRGVRALM